MTEKVFCLVPLTITDAMLSSSTVAEPAAGEAVYAAGTTYALGATVISTTTHRVYKSLQAGNIGHDPTLIANATWWLDTGPTLRWAAFDSYVSTASTATTPLTYVLTPGFVNALAIYGLNGAAYSVTVKDAPGGTTVYTRTGSLYAAPAGWYEYYFAPLKAIKKLVFSDLPIYQNPEITITISASAGVTVGAGMIAIGDMRNLLDSAEWGGTQYGATAEPMTYSYIKADDYGNTVIKRRYSATSMSINVSMPQESADYALQAIQDVLDVPACWIATDAAGYQGLNTFGLASGSVSYDGPNHAHVSIKVQGMI